MSEDEVDKTEQTLKTLTSWRAYLTDEDRATLEGILERIRPQVLEQIGEDMLGGLQKPMDIKPQMKLNLPGKKPT